MLHRKTDSFLRPDGNAVEKDKEKRKEDEKQHPKKIRITQPVSLHFAATFFIM
jgi:hypothetical protein